MNPNRSAALKNLGLIWLASWIELLMLLPVWLLADTFLVPPAIRGVWLVCLPFLSLMGLLARFRLDALWKQWMASALIGGLFAFIASAGHHWLYAVSLFAVGFAVALLGFSVYSRVGETRFYWWGIGLYFIAGIVFGRIPAVIHLQPLLTAAGCICLTIALFLSNRNFLRDATLAARKPQSVPVALRNHNRMFVGALLVFAVMLTAGLGDVVGRLLWNTLKTVIKWLLSGLRRSEPLPQPPAEQPAPQLQFPEASPDNGLLNKILEVIFYSFGYLLMAAIAAMLLYWMYKNAGGILRKRLDLIMAWLRRTKRLEEGAEYTDEESVVFSWESVKRNLSDGLLRRIVSGLRQERWETMSNRERIRYLYRRWLRSHTDRGYVVRRYLTPMEIGRDVRQWAETAGRSAGYDASLAELYNKARYSGDDVTEDEVSGLQKRLQTARTNN